MPAAKCGCELSFGPGAPEHRRVTRLHAAALLFPLAACGAPPEKILDGDRCFAHVRKLVDLGPRPSGSPGLEKARDYIVAQLKEAGLAPAVDRFTADTKRGPLEMFNVRAEIAGESKAVCTILTHYDTKKIPGVEFVGANDGTSGVGVLLEIARHCAKSKPPLSLRILFVDGEETQKFIGAQSWDDADALFGSRHEVARMREAKELDATKAVILLDMVGDKDLEIAEESQSGARMIAAVREAAKESGATKQFFGPRQMINDDHVPFIQAGIADAINLIDFEYGPGNSHWHTAKDTLDKISPESLRIVGDVVIRALPRVAKLFGPP